jgi:hypothetical protein
MIISGMAVRGCLRELKIANAVNTVEAVSFPPVVKVIAVNVTNETKTGVAFQKTLENPLVKI